MTETQKLYNNLVFKLGQVIKMLNEEEETPENMKIADKINDEVIDITIKLMDGENDFLKLEDLDKYSKKLLGTNYFVDKRCWEYLRDSLYDIYMNIPNHFDESMQTGLGMAQELPTNVMYKGGITNLYNKENKEMNKRLNEKKIDIETRKEALAKFLDVNVDEIDEGYSDDVLEYGNAEYLVLTDDEADEKAHDYTMELLDDNGLESLSKDAQEYCLENFINDSFFETVADEESDYYISEMSDEELLDYAHDHKIAKAIDDVDDKNFDRSDLEDQCKYEYRDEILDQGMSDYFEGIYGRNWAKEMKDTLEKELDFDAIADYVIESDGRANSLASYDGKENEIKVDGEWFYIYRTN